MERPDKITRSKVVNACFLWAQVKAPTIKCPECETGHFGGLYWLSCDNQHCSLYRPMPKGSKEVGDGKSKAKV